ncbi:MAG: hypothetical protein QSU88_13420, partial [Candidatus Methanoperedens sp.]|nr:hypothetical protein [Candidatus Methanoperedens sp.]
ELMETLKPIAIAEGIKNKNSKFDNIFSDVIKKTGRASEFLLISKYSLSEPGMIKQAPFGLSLMSRGKLPLMPDKMEDTRELDAIFKTEEEKPEKKPESGTKEKVEAKAATGENEEKAADTGGEAEK